MINKYIQTVHNQPNRNPQTTNSYIQQKGSTRIIHVSQTRVILRDLADGGRRMGSGYRARMQGNRNSGGTGSG